MNPNAEQFDDDDLDEDFGALDLDEDELDDELDAPLGDEFGAAYAGGDEDRPPRPDIAATVALLEQNAENGVVPAQVYYGLSDLTDDELATLAQGWLELPNSYRVQVMQRLAENAEENYERSYAELARFVLRTDHDGDAQIAAMDILGLEEDSASLNALLEKTADASPGVRAAAIAALSNYVLLGEYEKLDSHNYEGLQRVLISVWQNPNEPLEVRRRALEALSNSSLDLVTEAIQQAYGSAERPMQASAVFAMGRTCDDETWGATVLNELQSDDPEMRYQATRAAGELSLDRAVPALRGIVFDNDAEMRDMAVWSLGEIGGKRAVDTLNLLLRDAERTRDSDLVTLIEDALANAELIEGSDDFTLMRMDQGRGKRDD